MVVVRSRITISARSARNENKILKLSTQMRNITVALGYLFITTCEHKQTQIL
jgi:hypothetical protein